MKKLFALIIAMVMCVSLVACGGVDKQPAIDAFNNATDIYDKLVDEMNKDLSVYPPELIDVMNDMAEALKENKTILEGDTELTEENVAEMVSAFGEVQKWAQETYDSLDEIIAENVDNKQAVIDVFNETSSAFDAMTAKINANPAAYDQQTIDLMTQMANALIECKNLLESDKQLTAEDAETLIKQLTDIKGWVAEAEAVLVDGAAGASAGTVDKALVAEAFNAVVGMYDATVDEINRHPQDFSQEIIDTMASIAEPMTQYKALIESGAEFSMDEATELSTFLETVQNFLLEIESSVFG
ncbi:MAG: hypothetical protein J6C75_08000 [Oscillospiraceae bacterium]|nr:hypothetical protein [Oscillospiraceae bacterium]